MKRRDILAGATFAIALTFGSFAKPDAQPAPSPSASAPAAATVVEIKDFLYVPATITIAAGQQVTFKNDDQFAHTVTADDTSFDSGSIGQNATFSHVFATAGTYKYSCAFHAYMHGTVVVR